MAEDANQQGMNTENGDGPVIPSDVVLPEITLRVVVLGVILTIVLAAANAYLGLKVGTTISASIPAAIISMGILRFFKNANILENTMVQTMASVGEALTAGVSFILPALVIMRVWENFNYWQTVLASLLGGGLGVLFTIPLRRALLQDKALRYPEGLAIGNVLRASEVSEEGDLKALTIGGLVGSVIAFCQTGFQVLADSLMCWFKVGPTIVGFGLGFSPALIAAGYIVGINVAVSLFVGIVIGWLAGVPAISYIYGVPAAETANHAAMVLWSTHVRYIGVGTMLVGGIWTLLTLIKPVVHSVAMSFDTLRKMRLGHLEKATRIESDIPIHYVLIGVVLLMLPLYWMISQTMMPANSEISAGVRHFLAGYSTIYVLVGGFVFCSISSYFAGLVGSTNNPASGLLVSTLLILCLSLLAFFSVIPGLHANDSLKLFGSVVAIGSTVVIGAALAISNDTMQDLKVGQIVGATPWKQQMMLVLGVVVSAFVIPPILQLLYNAYGIGGVFPRPGMDTSQMLAAPQAGLMATVAQGAFSHQLDWPMMLTGAAIAVLCIIADEIAKTMGTRLPVLAVGVGIYLPLDSSVPVVIGGVLSYIVYQRLCKRDTHVDEKTDFQAKQQCGLMLSCGMVAGASLIGVILAIPFAIKQSSDALRIMPVALEPYAGLMSVVVTIGLCWWIYRSILRHK